MGYEPHNRLVKNAVATRSLKYLTAGIVLLVVVFVLLSLALNSVQNALIPDDAYAAWSDALIHATTPMGVLVNLYYFAVLVGALWMVLQLVHNRSLASLIGARGTTLAQFWRVTKFLIPIFLIVLLLPSPEPLEVKPNVRLGLWLVLLPVTLLGLLIQTSAEELVFRGYLQSQLAARFHSPIIWIGLPSLVFGALHYDPNVDETAAWIVTLWAVMFGVAAADLTARSGTLGPAIALHMVNNISAIALAAPEGSFDGLALYTYPISLSDTEILLAWMPVEILILFCGWLAARLALRV